jgi:hypothetical protein
MDTLPLPKSVELNKQYWDDFYKRNHRHHPSQFCISILPELAENSVIVELGSGNGRDSHYFSSQGHIAVALDLSHEAVKSCDDLAKSRNIEHATFYQGDMTQKEDVENVVKQARILANGRGVVFYSRFVMHALGDEQEAKLFQILSDCVRSNELVYFEFRSKEDEDLEKHFGGHFRRYIDTEDFKRTLSEEYGFSIDYSITGQGIAKYKEEDPIVSRVIARKI